MTRLTKNLRTPIESGKLDVLSLLETMPKREIPAGNFAMIRNRVLDNIYLPSHPAPMEGWFTSLLNSLPRTLKISGGIIGSFLILASLTIGTAVAALESIPGQPIYPLKKMVESVQLKLASNDDETALLQIKFTNNRLEELEKVLEKSRSGEISNDKAQEMVANTVKNLQETTSAAVSASTKSTSTQQKVALLTKLAEQSAVLQSAKIESEGEVKLELEKAIENTRISREEAIANIERAGLKVEATPIVVEEIEVPSKVTANGKLTAVSDHSLSVGTAKFTVTKDTVYVNVEVKELKVGDVVEITGEVVKDETYAIKVIKELKENSVEETPATEESQ